MSGRTQWNTIVLVVVASVAIASIPIAAVATPAQTTDHESRSVIVDEVESAVLVQENETADDNVSIGDGNETAGENASIGNEAVATAARQGAEDAIAEFEANGTELEAEQRQAVIEGAVIGAEYARAQADEIDPGTVTPAITADLVYTAAYGAASGTMFGLEVTPVSAAGVNASTLGATQAGVLVGAALQAEGSQLPATAIYLTTMGAAEGAAAQYGVLETDDTLYVDAEQADYAAYGGTAGALLGTTGTPEGTATSERLFEHAYFAAGGSTMGAIYGANERGAQEQPPAPEQTEMAATGTATGTMTGVIQRPDTDTNRTLNSSFDVAAGALIQSELGDADAIYQQTFTAALESIAGGADEPAPVPDPEEVPDPGAIPVPEPDTDPDESATDPLPEPDESPPIESGPVPVPDESTPIGPDPVAPGDSENSTAGDEVFPGPLTALGSSIGPPRDLTGDGLYEDVSGDGGVTYLDVVRLSQLYNAHVTGEIQLADVQMAAFDFNSDGTFDERDIHALDERIAGFDEFE